MRFLISNDDGIEAKGIQALASALRTLGEVVVVAPHRERSTSSHSLTLHKPLRIWEVAPNEYATSGTPADCIYLGTRKVFGANPPDVIVSGINAGANLGTDVHYSGTVAAAREGALLNIKSYAFSLVDLAQILPEKPKEAYRFEDAAQVAKEVIQKTVDLEFPEHSLLNVNIPNLEKDEIRGIVAARQGIRYYTSEVQPGTDPRGGTYYWIGGAYERFEPRQDSDCDWVNEGFVSVAPLSIDTTHDPFFDKLKSTLRA